MELIGKILAGRYEIIEKIGEGGMAYVFKARDNLLNRYVAVKVLRDEFTTDEEFIKRFNTEAQSAARLAHPNIVSVFDVGEDRGISYIVMELLENNTLKDYIDKKGALSSEMTLKIAAQIASALEAAHKANIVHRDIKPQNIILNQNMVAKVTDFGIAKVQNATSATITSFGSTMGSVHYFSPEHAKGGYTDAKSDIYSLGVVMYEMATGKLPFDGESAVSVALKHIQEEPVPPRDVNPMVSVSLNQIILKAMQKSTATRYQSASELLADISLALSNPSSTLVSRPVRTKTSSGNRTAYTPQNRVSEEDKEPKENKKDNNKKKKALIITLVCISLVVICVFGYFIGKIFRSEKEEEVVVDGLLPTERLIEIELHTTKKEQLQNKIHQQEQKLQKRRFM